MNPLSNNSQSLKVVLAVVVLFLGWLIASMIPRSETPWDKTSSSFLARRPVTGPDGELSDEESEYQRLWSEDKANWDPEKRNVTIDYDSDFFGRHEEAAETETGAAASSDDASDEERVRRWSDEIKVENESAPEIVVGERPKWEDDAVFDAPAADPQELAPPLSPLGSDWDEEPAPAETAETNESAEPAEPAAAESSEPAFEPTASADESPAPAEEPAAKEESLFAQAGVPAGESSADPPAETEPAPTLPVPNLPQSAAAAADEPKPLPTAAAPEVQPADTAAPAETAESTEDGSFPFPTRRPAEQVVESAGPAPQSAPQSESAAPLPLSTLTPSSGTRAATAVSPPPVADEGLISQVTANVPGDAAAQSSRSAYYQEPVRPSVSGPTAVSIYTAGAGENWDDIAAKSGLSDAEKARYFDVNSFRINSDRTVTEGMKLILPKR